MPHRLLEYGTRERVKVEIRVRASDYARLLLIEHLKTNYRHICLK